MMSQNLHNRITLYKEMLQEIIDRVYGKHYPNLTPPTITLEPGRRYVRVVKAQDCGGVLTQKSVHSFIDMTNGDVLMAASWKSPAKHARGNVFSEDNGMGGVNVYGANYLS